MEKIIASLKGTRDFYPEDMAVRSWLYAKLREVSESFGYQEYDGPFLEKIDLYAAKSGEELVKEQAFVFPDRGGDLITLRPELTPSLARMVAQRQKQFTYPLRWWSFGPFWRYERPQKGRTREFFQWNIDLIGANSPEGDAELIAICAAFFKRVGLSPQQVGIYVNDRRLMESQLLKIGIASNEMRKTVFKLIDRRDKMLPAEWDGFAIESGLTLALLNSLKSMLANRDLWQESPELTRVFAALETLGAAPYVQFDPQIIRGLDYYTATVFEARDLDREGRAILGGGHYDNLVEDVGGDPLPAVGFAMGDVMIRLILEKYGCLPEFKPSPADILVTVFEPTLLGHSLKISAELRAAGFKVACFSEEAKLPRQLKYADKMGIRFVVIVGPDEFASGQATVKDLASRQQATVPVAKILDAIREWLA
ncbi:MAG TPA: histidine--tRNA ligase [Bellilinea sp.]|nr:histidine--tRNA ligase [Bellilinea sp.]